MPVSAQTPAFAGVTKWAEKACFLYVSAYDTHSLAQVCGGAQARVPA